MRFSLGGIFDRPSLSNETTPLLHTQAASPLQGILTAVQPEPPPLLANLEGSINHVKTNIPEQILINQISKVLTGFRPHQARPRAPSQPSWCQHAASRLKTWLATGKRGAINEGLAKETLKLAANQTALDALHAATRASHGAFGGLTGVGGALGIVTEAVKTRNTRNEIRDGRERITEYQAAKRTLDLAKQKQEAAAIELKLAEKQGYGPGMTGHLEKMVEDAKQQVSAAKDSLRRLEASHRLGKAYSDRATERQAVHGATIGASASGAAAGTLKGIAAALPAIDAAAKGVNIAATGFTGIAAVATVPLSAVALANDVRGYRKNADFDAAVVGQIAAQSALDGDSELAAIAKLVHSRTETKGKVVSAVKNALGIAAGLAGGVASSAAIAAAAGAGAAAAVASLATPVGWALAGATAAVAIGYGLWKLGKYLHNQHQQQKLEGIVSGQGKYFEQAVSDRARGENGNLNQKLSTPEQIVQKASLQLLQRDPQRAANRLLERLRMEGADGATARFLNALRLGDGDLAALRDSTDNKAALALLMKKLNLA